MKRNSKIFKYFREFQNLPFEYLRPVEKLFNRKTNSNLCQPIIFLLALPRSGSTLTYQSIIHGLEVDYLTNLGNVFYKLPFLGFTFSNLFLPNYQSKFLSDFGFVPGLNGPSEGFKFWSYWTNSFLDEESCNKENIVRYRTKYFKSFLNNKFSQNRPFLAGYLGHILKINFLKETYPNSIFLRLRRNKINNAYSIFKARENNDNLKWFSVLPKESKSDMDKNIYYQIASQVYWLNKKMDNVHLDHKTIDISYEDLCKDPNSTIRYLRKRFLNYGLNLKYRNKLPNSFKYNDFSNLKRDPNVFKLSKALEKIKENND